jgi:hypothetical protein
MGRYRANDAPIAHRNNAVVGEPSGCAQRAANG